MKKNFSSGDPMGQFGSGSLSGYEGREKDIDVVLSFSVSNLFPIEMKTTLEEQFLASVRRQRSEVGQFTHGTLPL